VRLCDVVAIYSKQITMNVFINWTVENNDIADEHVFMIKNTLVEYLAFSPKSDGIPKNVKEFCDYWLWKGKSIWVWIKEGVRDCNSLLSDTFLMAASIRTNVLDHSSQTVNARASSVESRGR